MPKKTLFGEEGFKWLEHNLKRRGFKLISYRVQARSIERQGIIPNRPYRPMSAVFLYRPDDINNTYGVKVRTTYDMRAKSALESANGWVMIVEGDVRRYTARPLNRTENFLYNLLELACIARWRVDHRPFCEKCKADMDIHPGKYPKQVFWACPNGCSTEEWDTKKMPSDILSRVVRRRKAHRQTDARTRAAGKKPHAKMFKRAKRPPWGITKPENQRTSGPVKK